MPPSDSSLTRPQYPKEIIATQLIQNQHDKLMHQFGLGRPTRAPVRLGKGHVTYLDSGNMFRGRETHNIRLFDRAGAFMIKPVLRGDEELILRLSKGPGILAKEFKKARADLVRKVVIPTLKSQIPRSKIRRPFQPGHLRATARVVSSTLERVVVVTGNPKVWWSAIVHARWQPYFPITLLLIGDKFQRAYEVVFQNFMSWLATNRIERTDYTKQPYRIASDSVTFRKFQSQSKSWNQIVKSK